MRFKFESSGKPEYTVSLRAGLEVHVSKAGGGTLGKAYAGTWDVALVVAERPVFLMEAAMHGHGSFSTGTPKTHAEAARVFAQMVAEDFPELADDLDFFAASEV